MFLPGDLKAGFQPKSRIRPPESNSRFGQTGLGCGVAAGVYSARIKTTLKTLRDQSVVALDPRRNLAEGAYENRTAFFALLDNHHRRVCARPINHVSADGRRASSSCAAQKRICRGNTGADSARREHA